MSRLYANRPSPFDPSEVRSFNSNSTSSTASRFEPQAVHGFDFNSTPLDSTRSWETTTPSFGRPSVSPLDSFEDAAGNTARSSKNVFPSFASPSGSPFGGIPRSDVASSFGRLSGSSFGSFQDSTGNAARPYSTTASYSGQNSLFGPLQDAGRHTAQHHSKTVSSFSRPSGSSFNALQASAQNTARSYRKPVPLFDPPQDAGYIFNSPDMGNSLFGHPKTRGSAKSTPFSSSQVGDSVIDSPLFKLALELRKDIYRYALIKQGAIDITKDHGIPEPALLSACKIIRSETLEIFYGENDFTCTPYGFDHALCLLVQKI